MLGLWPVSLLDIIRSMFLVIILFAGPIFEHGVVDGAWKDWVRLAGVHETLSSWIGYRNFIVVRHLRPVRLVPADNARDPSVKSSSGAPS